MTGVHGMKTQNVLKKFAIGFGVLAVDDYVCAIDHYLVLSKIAPRRDGLSCSAFSPSLPRHRVSSSARIGATGNYARLHVVHDHGRGRARAPGGLNLQLVTARAKLANNIGGDSRLNVQQTRHEIEIVKRTEVV